TPMRSTLSRKSLTSPPAQNARPAPVTTTQRTAGSSSTSSAAWKRSRPSPRLSALKASGRLSVIVATPSFCSRVRNLKSIGILLGLAVPSWSAALGAPTGGARHGVQNVGDLQRFHQHHVDAVSLALLGRQLDTESRDEYDRHRRRTLLHGLGH